MHENEHEDGKARTSKARMDSFDGIATLHDEIGSTTSLKQYTIRFTKVRWLRTVQKLCRQKRKGWSERTIVYAVST